MHNLHAESGHLILVRNTQSEKPHTHSYILDVGHERVLEINYLSRSLYVYCTIASRMSTSKCGCLMLVAWIVHHATLWFFAPIKVCFRRQQSPMVMEVTSLQPCPSPTMTIVILLHNNKHTEGKMFL